MRSSQTQLLARICSFQQLQVTFGLLDAERKCSSRLLVVLLPQLSAQHREAEARALQPRPEHEQLADSAQQQLPAGGMESQALHPQEQRQPQQLKPLRVIVKADVQGSAEAVQSMVADLSAGRVDLKVRAWVQ